MTPFEFANYKNELAALRQGEVSLWHLDFIEGTLLYGYTCDRQSFHVYALDQKIHRVVYKLSTLVSHDESSKWQAKNLVPNKRVYPEYTDLRFVLKLSSCGVDATFTTWDAGRADYARELDTALGTDSLRVNPFYTKTHEEF